MAETTTRLGLTKPVGADAISTLTTGPPSIRDNATILDNAAMFASGTLAARPAAALAGKFYLATDTGQVYIDTGSAWVELARLAQTVPVGVVESYLGTTAPTGYLLMQGQAVTSTYAALRSHIIALGSPWGTSGSDPKLPDARGCTLVGAGQGSGLTLRAITDARLGAETVVLTASTIPAHTHDAPAHTHGVGTIAADTHAGHTHTGPSHTHSIPSHTHDWGTFTIYLNTYGGTGGAFGVGDSPGADPWNVKTTPDNDSYGATGAWSGTSGSSGTGNTGSAGSHTHTLSGATASDGGTATSSVGSGGAHENMQPSIVLNWIVKT